MTYRFHSKATGDVLMIEPAGAEVLEAMGFAPARRGIIEPAAMPAALIAVEEALRQTVASPTGQNADAEDEEHDAVSLRRRAWPLVEMMRRALAAKEPIVWGV